MIDYWKDCKTGEIQPWSSDKKRMEIWLKDHPPIYSWRVDLVKDESHIILTEYNPEGSDALSHLCDIKGIGMRSTDGSASYEIHCDNPREVRDALMCMNMDLKRDGQYALIHRRGGLGMTEELVQFCLKSHAPTNYGSNSDAFDYVIGYPSHWGYGAHGEVRFSEIEYPDGESWDTYQNERGFVKKDPTEEECIRWCNRITVSIQLSLDAKTTPTSILAKALRFTDDERVKEIVREVFTEDSVAKEEKKVENPYRYEQGISSALSRGEFSTSNYGERAKGSYDTDMLVTATDGGLEFDVGAEYLFHLDMDIVEDLLKVIQKCKQMVKEEEE